MERNWYWDFISLRNSVEIYPMVFPFSGRFCHAALNWGSSFRGDVGWRQVSRKFLSEASHSWFFTGSMNRAGEKPCMWTRSESSRVYLVVLPWISFWKGSLESLIISSPSSCHPQCISSILRMILGL